MSEETPEIQSSENKATEIQTTPKRKLKIVVPPKKPDIDQSWTVAKIVNQWTPYTWEGVFKDAQDELEEISDILEDDEKINGRPFFPLKKDLFRAMELTRFPKIKVVIFGQDPYPQKKSDGLPRAQGLSFSVSEDDQIPSSLKNIYRELENTVDDFVSPAHGDLTPWAKQGVLLLNSCLTVQQGLPASHGELWIGFIARVLEWIGEHHPKAVYVMWGKEAQKMKKHINNKSPMLEAAHPSGINRNGGFIGCNHFNKINNYLKKQGMTPIDWKLD